MSQILYDLRLSAKSFRDFLVISGTDYNVHNSDENICLPETLKWFKSYKNYLIKNKKTYQIKNQDTFYEWLI